MHTANHLRRPSLWLVPIVALTLAGCGTARGATSAAPSPSSSTTPTSTDTAGTRPRADQGVALLSTESGVVAVEAGTTDVRWSAPGAVAALDGSAVFAKGSGTLVELDPVTGRERASWPVDAALDPVVVAPGGDWVALTDHADYVIGEPPAAATQLLVVAGHSGRVRARFDLAGDIEPEAFSPAGDQLIVLDHRGPTYRVNTLDLGTGEQYPTVDENKNEVGDMAGRRVAGVLSADKMLLATLYQTSDGPEPGAFVHVLNLGGLTYCVGLPSAFGRGPDGSVVVERRGDDVIVISEPTDQRATFSFSDLIAKGSNHVEVKVTPGAGIRADDAYRTVPGFRSLVAVIPPTASSPASPSSARAPG
jgi:hypothetical protein